MRHSEGAPSPAANWGGRGHMLGRRASPGRGLPWAASSSPGAGASGPCPALVLLLASLAAGACAPRPTEELRRFSSAAETGRASVQPLLDDLAAAERGNRREELILSAMVEAPGIRDRCAGPWVGGPSRDRGYPAAFCLSDAPYYATAGDPPVAAALRRGLDVVVAFAAALRRLVEGDAAEAETAQLARAAGELEALATAAGPAAPAGAAAVAAAIGPATKGLLVVVVRPLLHERDARRARDLILAEQAAVDALIAALAAAAEKAEPILTARASFAAVRAAGDPAAQAARAARVNAQRAMLGDYVVMLERTRMLWRAVVDSAEAPQGLRAAALADGAADFRAHAEAFRRGYAALRNAAP